MSKMFNWYNYLTRSKNYNMFESAENKLFAQEFVNDRLVIKDSEGKIHYFSSDEKIEQQLKNLNDRIDSLGYSHK